MHPVRAYEEANAAAEQRVKGTQVSLPGEPEPGWASAPSEDDE
jgi:hypothetical protein